MLQLLLGAVVRWGSGQQGAIAPPQTSALPPQYFNIQVQKGAFCGLKNTPKCVSGRGLRLDYSAFGASVWGGALPQTFSFRTTPGYY